MTNFLSVLMSTTAAQGIAVTQFIIINYKLWTTDQGRSQEFGWVGWV